MTKLDHLLQELRERYTVDLIREGFVTRVPDVESLCRRIAWTADIRVGDEPAHKQIWWGYGLFIGHPVYSVYQWVEDDPEDE